MSELIDLRGFRAEVSAIALRLDALQHQERSVEAVDPLARAALAELQTTVEELQVSQEELTAQSEALLDSRKALEQEYDRYKLLFQAAPVAYLVTDGRGIITQANRAAVELFNVDERFLLSKPLATFVVPAQRSGVRQHILSVAGGDQRIRDEFDIQPRRQAPRPAAVDVAPLRSFGREDSLLWLLQDLSRERALLQRSEQLVARLTDPGDASPTAAAVTVALEELRGLLLDEVTLEEALTRVAQTGRRILPGSAGVSASLFEQGRPRAVGASALWVEQLDGAQYSLGEGPCVLAMVDGSWHAADNLDEEVRWPRFAVAAADQGVLSALAVPLLVRGARLGVLNIYGSKRSAFDGEAVAIAQRLAEVAAVLVANAQVLSASNRLAEELRHALVSRATVDMAKGVLMARLGVDADTAFDALRDLSQRRHLKLRDLAAEIVAAPKG